MKRFIISCAVAMIAILGLGRTAGNLSWKVNTDDRKQYEELPSALRRAVAKHAGERKALSNALQKAAKASKGALPEIDTEVIYEQPEGELRTYTRKGPAYMDNWMTTIDTIQNGIPMYIVYEPDGKTVWMNNIVSWSMSDAWVKCSIEGDKIHMPLYKSVFRLDNDFDFGDDDFDFGDGDVEIPPACLSTVKMDWKKYFDSDLMAITEGFIIDVEATEMTYTIHEDGTITLDGTDEMEDGHPKSILGLIWSDTQKWSNIGDYQTIFAELTDEMKLMPEGASVDEWYFHYNQRGIDRGRLIKGATVGDKLYLAGLSNNDPESVVEGIIADGKVTFASDQYFGSGSFYQLFFCAAKVKTEKVLDEQTNEYYDKTTLTYSPQLVMDYDAERKVLTAASDDAVLMNKGKGSDRIFYGSISQCPEFGAFKNVPATPAAPQIVEVDDTKYDQYGYNYLSASIKLRDDKGNFINPDNLKYILYVKSEGEPKAFVFSADDYFYFEWRNLQPLTELPYSFMAYTEDGYYDIKEGGKAIFIYHPAYEDYGMQTVYYGGGERRISEIQWYGNTANGICNTIIKADTLTEGTVFGIDGKRLNTLRKGINIVRMQDGIVRKVVVK